MENLSIVSVPIIVSVVYALIGVITKAVNGNEKFKRFIPLLALILGAVIGGILFAYEPSLIGAESAISAIITGGASGLAATGTDQIVKQITKNKYDTGDSDDDKKQ